MAFNASMAANNKPKANPKSCTALCSAVGMKDCSDRWEPAAGRLGAAAGTRCSTV